MRPLRVLGMVIGAAGLALAFVPTLLPESGPPADLFAAIERRIPGGAVLGLGLLLALQTAWRPRARAVGAFVLWMTTGVLAARLVGLALDGSDARQWGWVGVEVVVIAGSAALLRAVGRRATTVD